MKHLVVGCGEVGKALMQVLGCPGYDPPAGYTPEDIHCDMLHVCVPYSAASFRPAVSAYQQRCRPTFTVIHSTVPIGTSDSLNAHHSPIRGRHPHLAGSIRTFVKYVGGPEALLICAVLQQYGIEAMACSSARDTEAGKLIDLMQFGQAVLLEKSIHEFCERNKLTYDIVYRHFNKTYNQGYTEMGDCEFMRPVLNHVDGPIGGHCVVQNMMWLEMLEAIEITEVNKKLSFVKEPA